MIGEMLYHLHRHFRLVLAAGALALIGLAVSLACATARHYALI